MREYILKRIIVSFFVLFVIATVNFTIFQVVSPIDPAATVISPEFTAEEKALIRREYGLDEDLSMRYLKYIRNMLTWNFGLSFSARAPVLETLASALPFSLTLLGTTLIFTIFLGIPIGILAGAKRGTKADVSIMTTGLFLDAMPIFFLELLMMLLLCYYLGMWTGFSFPLRWSVTGSIHHDPIGFIANVAYNLFAPVTAMVIGSFGSWALYSRNLIIDALTQDYIITARAKGLSERTVLYRHAFAATLPVIATMITLAAPGLIMGAMITEYIFTLPGVGRWYLGALLENDYPVVQGVLYVYAVLVVAANLIADLLYGILDPRIRVGSRR